VLELDVADIETVTQILKENGYSLLVQLQKEPWGKPL
jgi:uncharacterized glyoxalase superfamily protein PhnB